MILSILGVSKLRSKKTEVLMRRTEERNTSQVQQRLAFGVVNALKEIHLLLERSRLVHNKTHNACSLHVHQQHLHACCALAAKHSQHIILCNSNHVHGSRKNNTKSQSVNHSNKTTDREREKKTFGFFSFFEFCWLKRRCFMKSPPKRWLERKHQHQSTTAPCEGK